MIEESGKYRAVGMLIMDCLRREGAGEERVCVLLSDMDVVD